ncbi:MAG: spondin domain-containing protein, partial [Candidatus Binatia bacterium]
MSTKLLSLTAALLLSIVGIASGNGGQPTKFTITIENVTKPDAFTASNGVKWSLAFSPGLAVVHTENAPIFTSGKKDRGQGLEAQSEDGNPDRLAKSLLGRKGIKSVTVFNTPTGAGAPGPITPGAVYEITISAAPGDRLTLTTMMGQSNDWFYAPGEASIELFKHGKPISGDLSTQIMLWDAGTEVDQEVGIGPDQGPRQKGSNTGKAENGVVRKIDDGKVYSKAADVMRVTITPLP